MKLLRKNKGEGGCFLGNKRKGKSRNVTKVTETGATAPLRCDESHRNGEPPRPAGAMPPPPVPYIYNTPTPKANSTDHHRAIFTPRSLFLAGSGGQKGGGYGAKKTFSV